MAKIDPLTEAGVELKFLKNKISPRKPLQEVGLVFWKPKI